MNAYDYVLREERNIRSCTKALKISDKALTEILTTINTRINRDRDAKNQKETELKVILSSAASDTVKRMAQIDFDESQVKITVKATEAERAAFEEEIERFKQALADLKIAHSTYEETIRALNKEIEKSRSEIKTLLSTPYEEWGKAAEETLINLA